MKKKFLICFIGIDGSGKSTLAEALIIKLRKHNIEAEYSWCKFESSLFRFLISIKNKFFIRETDWKINYKKSFEVKNNLFQKKYAYIAYEWYILMDYTTQIVNKIALPLKLGKNIVCDRYIYDTIVDISVDLNYSDKKTIKRINQLLKYFPKPDLVFWVDVPEEVSICRKDDIPSINFLTKKRKIYRKIGSEFTIINLDGTESLQELNKQIWDLVIKSKLITEE